MRVMFVAGMVLALLWTSASRAAEQPTTSELLQAMKALQMRVDALEAEVRVYKGKSARGERAVRSYAPAQGPVLARTNMQPSLAKWYIGGAFGLGQHHLGSGRSQFIYASMNTTVFPGLPPFTNSSQSTSDSKFTGRSAGLPSGQLAGITGVDVRLSDHLVVGLRAEGAVWAGTDQKIVTRDFTPGTTTITAAESRSRPLWTGTLLARAGYSLSPTTLAYVGAGATYGVYEFSAGTASGQVGMVGGTLGAGIERDLDENWRILGEYRYTRFSPRTDIGSYSTATTGLSPMMSFASTLNVAWPVRIAPELHTFRIGVIRRFH